jgi:hypothetical protein
MMLSEPTYAFEISAKTLLTALAASLFELKKKIFLRQKSSARKVFNIYMN